MKYMEGKYDLMWRGEGEIIFSVDGEANPKHGTD